MIPCNLTPTQWSNVLLNGSEPQRIARKLQSGNAYPWSAALLEHTAQSRTTLDLGSGNGQHSAMLALAGKQTTLVDWSHQNVEFSMKLFAALNVPGQFCRADMLNPLPFKDAAFDTVFSCGVFEYFSDLEIREILKEAFRVARKQVIVMVPNSLSIAYRIGKFYMERAGTWEWGGERPFPTLKRYYHEAGCRHVEELSVAAKTSLDFLTMRGGQSIQRIFIRALRLTDNPRPALFKQGYLLMTIGEKS